MMYQKADGVARSFDDAMNSYYESDSVKEDTMQFNIRYYTLRNRLFPEEREMLDGIYGSMEQSSMEMAQEAYKRGFAAGRQQAGYCPQPEMEPGC